MKKSNQSGILLSHLILNLYILNGPKNYLNLVINYKLNIIKWLKIKDYWKFLRENFELNNNSKFFITSDREDIIDEASQEFSNETIIAFRNRSFQIAKKNEINKESECVKISELYLDFFFLRECNEGIISHSGFGLIGILNRKNKTDLNKFYVYTNPNQLMNNWSDRSTLSFYKFNSSFLYLEFRYLL